MERDAEIRRESRESGTRGKGLKSEIEQGRGQRSGKEGRGGGGSKAGKGDIHVAGAGALHHNTHARTETSPVRPELPSHQSPERRANGRTDGREAKGRETERKKE